jgi:hypothetical protein
MQVSSISSVTVSTSQVRAVSVARDGGKAGKAEEAAGSQKAAEAQVAAKKRRPESSVGSNGERAIRDAQAQLESYGSSLKSIVGKFKKPAVQGADAKGAAAATAKPTSAESQKAAESYDKAKKAAG